MILAIYYFRYSIIQLYNIYLVICMDDSKKYTLNILNEYKILELIETGTQAKVFLAEKQGKLFCIKMYFDGEKQHSCFLNECRILSSLQNSGIVQLVESYSGSEPGMQKYLNTSNHHSSFAVLEYCRGRDLQKYLKYSPFSQKIARTLIKNILVVLRYLSSKSIIHRDIKAENIVIKRDGSIKFIDFGYSLQKQSKRKQLVGTLPYIAPQIHTKRQYSTKSDIFSIGVLYYLMISGLYPFTSSKLTDKIYNLIIQKKFKTFWQLTQKKSSLQNISPSVKVLIESMLSWKPESRPDIQEMMQSQQMSLPTANQEEIQIFFKSCEQSKDHGHETTIEPNFSRSYQIHC